MNNETTIAAIAQFVQSINVVKARWSELQNATAALSAATDDYIQSLDSVQRSARELIESLSE